MHTIAVIGAGKIGEVLLSGLLRAGWAADRLLATARRAERATELKERYGVDVVDNETAVERADVLAVAVKPQDAEALLADLGPRVPAEKLVVSLCAGLPTSFFAKWLPAGTPVIRVMTNTPALVDQAMTAISAGPHATPDHLALAEEMFRPLGRTIQVPESQQDAVTALSGSGPAYFYYLVEARRPARRSTRSGSWKTIGYARRCSPPSKPPATGPGKSQLRTGERFTHGSYLPPE
jgi:pyrroline-5-carboxylate reductase